MRYTVTSWLGVGCLWVVLPALAADRQTALDNLLATYPGVQMYQLEDGRIGRLYGPAWGFSETASGAAETFLAEFSEAFGVRYEELELVDESPLMRDERFTAFFYDQFKDGVPVDRAGITLLVRHDVGNGLVLVSADLYDLLDVALAAPTVSADAAVGQMAAAHPGFRFDEPELIVYPHGPIVYAWRVVGEKIAGQGEPEKYEWTIDATSGVVLRQESLIYHVDVTGNVSGYVTQGIKADLCSNEALQALPYLRVSIIGGNSAFADQFGNFTIPHPGSDRVTVESTLRGRWFRVYNRSSSNARLTLDVIPPGPANFEHNPSRAEYTTAEVNGYLHANVVRDYAVSFSPYYATRLNHSEFPVNVNIAGSCNAYYDGSSINFYYRSSSCDNMAFSPVVYHEYGHHLVQVGGSGQGQYGEGASDTTALVIEDDPGLAYGFYRNQCNTPLRSANNIRYYPCNGGSHDCGQLLSGCVWETRQRLVNSKPTRYLEILRELWFNSIPLHRGTQITPQITIDWLTLDDDDGNINNGTPHYCEIAQAFATRRMDAPRIRGDLDGDWGVNQKDLATLLAAFGVNNGGDIDRDGDTDQADLAILLSNYGAGCQ